ncbi:MAG: leucyl aminopeptidase family protein [Caulobacteraceae bacterium]
MCESLKSHEQAAAALADFNGGEGQIALLGDEHGRLERVLFGLGEGGRPMSFRDLAGRLPAGAYRLDSPPADMDVSQIAIAFALGAYRFDRYKKATPSAHLTTPSGADAAEVRNVSHALALARDMINTPANDLGPLQVETIAREIAEAHGARITVTVGDDLIAAGFPAVHAVGRAATAHRAPRMIEMCWGEAGAPLIAIVGKGVVFDSGGLDIKPSAGMRLMKKDMGGAAHALALARMMMTAKLPVRLAVLVPAVENAVAGDAMRPGDILGSRKGLTIEVGNTDAEGRLILADALALAGELEPDLTIDLATLTGAARVALGPDVPPFYTDDDALAGEIAAASARVDDPVWRMPLWRGYEPAIDSDLADVTNEADAWAQAGSITAALFLKRFAPPGAWVHFDIFAWNPRARPGWPKGAEVQAIRALYAMLKGRFA